MRALAYIIVFILNYPLFSRNVTVNDVDPWNAHIGFMAGMNTSILQMTGGFGPHETSTVQWTADFGMYYKSNVKNMFRLEVQNGFEVSGAGREYFYQRDVNTFIRIFDRYRTIPLTLLLNRNFGWKESVSLGIGFKSSFVVNYTTRHSGTLNQTGIILTPEVLRLYGSPVVQLSANLPYAEVAMCGWYAVTPVVDQFDVTAAPYGVTFLVKARLYELGLDN